MRGRLMRSACAAISVLMLSSCEFLVPTPDRTGQVRVPWVLSSGADNRLEIGVMVGGADCSGSVEVEAAESDQNVEVRAWVEVLRADSCSMVRIYRPVTVDLSSPLGDRPLTGCMIEVSTPHHTRESCAELVGD